MSELRKLTDIEKELSISRWTLYDWIREGKLAAFKLPCGHFRVLADEVKRLRQELAAKPGQPQ